MREPLPLATIHEALLDFLRGRKDAVLFGAIAVNAYVSEPRMTQDIDLLSTDAKNLADEYRRIGQQFVWIFDINVARENQPLEAPRLLDALDSMVERNEISDAAQMIPLLDELNNDERIPLIARNHAAKLVKQIEKKK